VNGQGQQTVTITNPNDFYLNAAVQESGLVTAAADIASVRKPKTVASGKARIAPHKKATVKLKLSKAAQKYLKKHHHLKVVLTITLTATGHKPKLVSKKLTLKRRT
jgi:hypothetical protein